jgi:dolichyl-diphosphooligosaccharide--protein glycosyltransferase
MPDGESKSGRIELLLIPIVIIAFLFRFQNFGRVFASDSVIFNGYDSYYHMRLVEVIVKAGERITFDSYLNYPYGLKISWLPLYHYILSLPSFIGFSATEFFAALLPPLTGVVSVFAIYFIAKEITSNRYIAIISAFLAAGIPKLVSLSVVGNSDYHSWNLTFFLLSVYFFFRALNTENEKKYILFLTSGVSLAVLAASWLGGSIYTGVLALIAAIAVKNREIGFKENTLVFAPPLLTSFLLPFVFPIKVSGIFIPFLGIWMYLIVTEAFCNFSERFASRKLEKSIKTKKNKGNLKTEDILPVDRHRFIAMLSVTLLSLLAAGALYITGVQIVRSGINYILGFNPYLSTIAEARSFMLPLIVLETGIFTFLVSIPAALLYILKKESRYEELTFWLIPSLVLTLFQIRFSEILIPLLIIYASYGICHILQASNLPVFGERMERKRKKRKEKKVETIWGTTEIAYSLVVILFISSTGFFFSLEDFDISENWVSALKELGEISPETSYYLNPSQKPEYSVLSWWDYGNWILYIAKRPVVCNNFQAGAKDAALFFVSDNESSAIEILRKRGVKYIITDDKMMLGNETFRGKFQAIMKIAGIDVREEQKILEIYQKSIFYKLHVEEGKDIKNIKLISKHGDVKVFEFMG